MHHSSQLIVAQLITKVSIKKKNPPKTTKSIVQTVPMRKITHRGITTKLLKEFAPIGVKLKTHWTLTQSYVEVGKIF